MRKELKRAIKKVSWILFIIYLILMAYFLFFSEYLNRSNASEYHYNLTLLNEVHRSFWCYHAGMYRYFFLNFVMNIVAFIPFGFFLPFLSYNRGKKKFTYVIFCAFSFTLLIELTQLVLKVGTFDVDDILLNTIGGLIGFILYVIAQLLRIIVRKVIRK